MSHHLHRMADRGEVLAYRRGGRQFYSWVDGPDLAEVLRLLRSKPGAVQVLRHLNEAGASSIQGIAKALRLDRKVVRPVVQGLLANQNVRLTGRVRAPFELACLPRAAAPFLQEA